MRQLHILTQARLTSATIFKALLALLLHTNAAGLVTASQTSEATKQSSRSPEQTQKYSLKLNLLSLRNNTAVQISTSPIKEPEHKLNFWIHYSLPKAMPCLDTRDEFTFVPLRNVAGWKMPRVHCRRAVCPFCLLNYLISHLLIQE